MQSREKLKDIVRSKQQVTSVVNGAIFCGTLLMLVPANAQVKNTFAEAPSSNSLENLNANQFIANQLGYHYQLSGTTNLSIAAQSDNRFGTGANIQANYSGEDIALSGLYRKLQHAHYSLMGASAKIGFMNVTGTYSTGAQSAKKVTNHDDANGNIQGDKKTIALTFAEFGILKNLGFKFSQAKTDSRILKTSQEVITEVSTTDLSQMIETLTKTYQHNMTVDWTGGRARDISLIGGLLFTPNHYLEFSLGSQRIDAVDANTKSSIGGLGYSYLLSNDVKLKLGATSSHQNRSIFFEYAQRFADTSGQVILGMKRNTYSNNIAPNTMFYAGFSWTFDTVNRTFTSLTSSIHNNPSTNLLTAMNSGLVDPQALGHIRTTQTKNLLSQNATYTPKAITATVSKLTVLPDGRIQLTFNAPAASSMSPTSIAEIKNPPPANQSVTYTVDIRNADNTTESHVVPTGMLTWTSPRAYSAGTYSIVLKTTNTVNGKVASSMSDVLSATILGDQAAQVQELNIISLNYLDAIISYGVVDLDGVRNQSWSATTANGQVLNIVNDENKKQLTITGATPGSTVTVKHQFETAIRKADGTLNWVAGEKNTLITLKLASDHPTQMALEVNGVTSNSAVATCNLTDADGIQNALCSIKDGNNVLITQWNPSQNNQTITNLLPLTTYQLYVSGQSVKINPDNTKTFAVAEKNLSFTTLVTPDAQAPVITLNGASTINVVQGQPYTESGASCVDNKDATCTVVITGNVNTTVAADYTLTYTATDSAGNVSVKTRTVKVVAAIDTPAQVTLPSTTITKTSITFSGGSVFDIDAAEGFNYNIRYIVKDMSGHIVSSMALNPGTKYQYIMRYNAWNKVTNSIITGIGTSPILFTTQADEPTFCELYPTHPNCQ
ncbi:DUF5011 domain-containing protein [Undibacterium fentianense]|uniref:DUF5011 domain-containing protein n=1 Tax=Undibacterium fentianense TaxID=2828728 RepID=A0A941DZC0_9BURK|nr:DUF5011 domain-containing protein [Undibacterium fentianense]MBR7799535.1 DUF5011 domain-containing protein [Undibacterium fentianense]